MLLRGLIERRRQFKASLQARKKVSNLSEADLADMGIKRYQLEHITRG